MKLWIQFGSGMMSLTKELISNWGINDVILSPRDLNPDQLERFSNDINSIGGSMVIDPQFYLPRADHHRLISHEYWPDDYDTATFNRKGRAKMIKTLSSLNDQLGTKFFIVPGERAQEVTDDWIISQTELLNDASKYSSKPLMTTICLSSEIIRNTDQIGILMEQIEQRLTPAYYLVFEKPGYSYFVEDPQWVANTLDLVAGLKLKGAFVVIGCSNQQQLIMSCGAADGIASGNWMNVRSFFPHKYKNDYSLEIKRKAPWYYLPQALSEYTIPFLDIGFRLGLVEELKPNPSTPFVEPLFEVHQPSSIYWGETDSFRHYLVALSLQIESIPKGGFDEVVKYHRNVLDRAEEVLKNLIPSGIRGRAREFFNSIDTNNAALQILERTHGPLLKRKWPIEIDLV